MIKIKPSKKNVNLHTKEGMELLETSIDTVGVIESISVTAEGTIISGHARKTIFDKQGKTAKEIHLAPNEYPVIVTDIKDNTKEYYQAQILANTTANHNFNLDTELINEIAVEYDIDIEELGVEVEEVQYDLEAKEDDFDTTPPAEPITVLGDLYEIGEHRLLCGDSTDSDQVAKLMNGDKADMVFTDPPYNIDFNGTMGYTSKNGEMITMSNGYNPANSKFEQIKNDNKSKEEFEIFIKDIIKNIYLFLSGAWYICFSSKNINEILNPLIDLNKEWKSIIIWNKNQSSMGGGHFKKKYEPIIYGYNENKFYGKEYGEEDVWDIQRTLKNDLHPTMKPINLIEKAINISTINNNIILDVFLGSGSTMVASHQLKRKCYGMELDPKYCDVIIKRMIKLDDTLTIKRNGIDCKTEFI